MDNSVNTNVVTYAPETVAVDDVQPIKASIDLDHTHYVNGGDVGIIPNAQHPHYSAGAFQMNIKDYMERPTIVLSGTIPNGSYGLLSSYNMVPNGTFFTNNGFKGNTTGAIGTRFTLCFKIEISAVPQAAGIFKIGFRPASYTAISNDPINFPTAYSQLPSAEVNLADSSTAIFKYPYNWDSDFLVTTSNDIYGVVGVAAYTPFEADLTTGLTSTYTVYSWVEDLELVGPGTPYTTTVTPQMGDGLEFKEAGPVSKMMGLAKRVSTALGSSIPLLKSYTRPLSWVFSGVGSLASQFGWSMPNDATMNVMGSSMGKGYNNVTGIEHAQELGAFGNNEVKVMPFFASKDFDEMSICALTCIPTPIAQFPLLGATDTAGGFKWTCPVTPSAFYFQKASTGFVQQNSLSATTAAALPSTILGTAQFFGAWRGDLVFRFKFARSKFMGGKVLLGYNPYPNVAANSVPVGRRYDFTSAVIDLRTTTTYDFEVPFTYYTDFAPTGMVSYAPGLSLNTGNVFMQILEPLVASGSTATTCWVQVEVFSKCGLIYADLVGSPFGSVPAGAPLIAQMGMSDDEGMKALETTCGESILSVKQIAMRPDWRAITNTGKGSLPDDIWSTPFPLTNTGTPAAPAWQGPVNAFNQICSWYLFYRGSVIWRRLPTSGSQQSTFAWIGNDGSTVSAPVSIESRMVNAVRRPFYSFHNRMFTNSFKSSTPQFNQQIQNNDFVHDGPSLLTVVPGDDFQFGGFVYMPPIAVAATNKDFGPTLYI